MFNFKSKQDKSECRELKQDIKRLEKDKKTLSAELEELKLKKKLESEDIKHMVKINSERKDIELEKAKVDLERKQQSEIAQVKDNYRDKTEKQLEKEVVNMKEMYAEILGRLPNYNVSHKVSESR